MSVKVGTAYVDVDGDFGPLNSGLDGLLKGGKWKAVAAGIAGIGAAAGVAGKALYDIGGEFDDAYDKIRVSTGKTGKALKGLEGDFKNVVKDVPTDFGKASDAVATINQRLGLTGKPLRESAKQFLELSRITGTDLKTNIESASRAFGDWNVTAKKQPAALDELFRAFQKTGVPVAKLSDLITKYGAPLRQLGFGFTEATALVGNFEKAGVNTQLVMGSMRIALGKLAKAGEDPKTAFARLTTEIKNAGSTSEANGLALKLFGARAGPDMAAAIREGKFAVGDLEKAIGGSGDTIRKAGKDTEDFDEKWQKFKNRLKIEVEPVATAVFASIGKAMDALPKIAEKVRGAVDSIKAAFTGGSEAGTRLSDTFTGIVDVGEALAGFADKFWDRFGKVITDDLSNTLNGFKKFAGGVLEMLQGIVDFVAGVFTGDWRRAWDGIKEIFHGAWQSMKSVVDFFVDKIKTAVRLFGTAVASMLSGAWSVITAAADTAWEAIKTVILTPLRGARDAIETIASGIGNRLSSAWDTIRGAARDAWDAVKDAILTGLRAARDAVPDVLVGMFNRVETGFSKIVSAAGGFAGDVKDKIVGAFKGAANGVIGFVNAMIGAINKIPGIPDIGKIDKLAEGGQTRDLALPAFARGGVAHHSTLARGAQITRPMMVVGEEAPRHNEFIIPTNPAYRRRALDLTHQLMGQLKIPGYMQGGVNGSAGAGVSSESAFGTKAESMLGILSKGASWVTDQFPNPADMLPPWLRGLGSWLIDKAGGWVKDKVKSILPSFGGGGGSGGGSWGGGSGVNTLAIQKTLAQWFGLSASSGYRSPSHNAAVGGVANSLHTHGSAGNPGAIDLVGPLDSMKAASLYAAKNLHPIENLIHDVGSGLHLHLGFFKKGGVVGGDGGSVLPFVGSYKDGGIVPRDGMAHVHQGETITPHGAGTHVSVFIDGQEFRGMIRTEIEDDHRAVGAAYGAGSLR